MSSFERSVPVVAGAALMLFVGCQVHQSGLSDDEAVRATMRRQRDIGTALVSWITDRAVEAPPNSVAEGDDSDSIAAQRADSNVWTVPSFMMVPANDLSESELRDLLQPHGRWTQEMLDSLFPLEDGWGHPLRIYLRRDDPLAPRDVAAILSPGRNGIYEGPTYEIGPFGYSSDVDDLVWVDGFFVRWPGPPVFGKAEAGDPSAQLEVARLFYSGESKQLPQNCEAAISWSLKAAENRVPEAQRMAGHMLEHGIGTERDVAAARRWYEAAAEAGDSISQARLGDLLRRDFPNEAERWLTAAAAQGDANAMFSLWNLGGNTRDLDKWLQMAADLGHAEAHMLLARRYDLGLSVPKNFYRAFVHHSVAKALDFSIYAPGSFPARRLEAIEAQLPPAHLIQAQQEATRLFNDVRSRAPTDWIGDCR